MPYPFSGTSRQQIGSRARLFIETSVKQNYQDRLWRHPRIGTIVQQSSLNGQKRNTRKTKLELKQILVRAKISWYRYSRNKSPQGRRAVLDACGKMDSLSELATDVLTSFAEIYISIDEVQKSMPVSNELEKILDEYSSAREAATDHLESRQDERSSVTSDILTIDMLEHMNISETNKKEVERQQVLPQTEQVVSAVYANKNNPAILPVCKHIQTNQTCSRQNENEIKNVVKFEDIRSRNEQQIRDNYSIRIIYQYLMQMQRRLKQLICTTEKLHL